MHAERVVHNEDLLYNRILYLKLNSGLNQFFIDDSKHFVDWGIHLTHHTSFKKLLVGYRFHLMRTYNFNWRYDPFGAPGPFRYPGINVWSMNAQRIRDDPVDGLRSLTASQNQNPAALSDLTRWHIRQTANLGSYRCSTGCCGRWPFATPLRRNGQAEHCQPRP